MVALLDIVFIAHLDMVKTGILTFWQVEDKGLVEDGVQSPLLDVRLFLHDPLLVEQQVDLHIRICKTENFIFLVGCITVMSKYSFPALNSEY